MANFFDQFDNAQPEGNFFDQFDEAPKNKKGQSIPGAEAYDEKPAYVNEDSLAKKAAGVGEAALTLGTGAGASLAAIPLGAVAATRDLLQGKDASFRKSADQIVENLTYQPRTETGGNILESLAPAMDVGQAMGPTGYVSGQLSKAMTNAAHARGLRALEAEQAARNAGKAEEAAKAAKQAEAPAGPVLRPEEAGAGPMRPEGEYTPVNRRQMNFFDQFDNQTPDIAVDTLGEAVRADAPVGDLLGREAAQKAVQADLDAAAKQQQPAVLQGPEGQMDLMERQNVVDTQNPYMDVNHPAMVVDENGMPVRADLSMEANNLEAPLQRNLWGDELGPALEQQRSLTDAIDTMPAGEVRQTALDLFRDENKFGSFDQDSIRRIRGALASGDPAVLRTAAEANMAATKKMADSLSYAEGKGKFTALLEQQKASYRNLENAAQLKGANDAIAPYLQAGPQTLETLLSVAHPHLPPVLQNVASALLKVIPEATVRLDKFDKGGLGVYHGLDGGIKLADDSPMTAALTLLHEGVHAATVRALVTEDHLRAAAETMLSDLMLKDPSLKYEYGFTNIKEFVAEAMTNPGLQERLKGMEASKAAGNALAGRSMWQKFMDLVRKSLGLPATKEITNALDQAMQLGSTTMLEQYALKGSAEHMAKYEKIIRDNASETNLPTSAMDIGPRQVQDDLFTPRSPETIAKKEELARVASYVPSSDKRLQQFEAVTTPEQAVAMAADTGYKDSAPGTIGTYAGSGVNFSAARTNNPILKFVNTMQRQVRSQVNTFTREHLAGPTGIGKTWDKLSSKERGQVVEALRAGDRNEVMINADLGRQMGLNEKQMAYVDSFYRADAATFKMWNDARANLGMEPVQERVGHVPSVWSGAYRSVATTPDGPVVISVDSRYALKKAKEFYQAKYPGVKFADADRKWAGGVGRTSNIFSGVNDLVQLLAQNDPRFADIQAAADVAIKASNDSLYGVGYHAKEKYGIKGSLGDAPWRNAEKNAADFHQGMISYFEQAAQHHAMQVPLHDIKNLMVDPNLPMPKTKQYLAEYVNHMEGRPSKVGEALNTILDAPAALIGFGHGSTMKLTGELRNQMSRLFMGWGNYVFTLQQLAQMGQTATPMYSHVASELGMNPAYAAKSQMKGLTDFARAFIEGTTGKDMGLSAHMKEAYEYAKEHGMLQFSEMEHDYRSGGKVSRAIGDIADLNIMLGEKATRAPVFMGMVDLMVSGGMPIKEALTKAENATYLSMFDYHAFERPQMYAKLGMAGRFAGALTTYKHGYLSNLTYFGQKPVKNALPIVASIAAMTVFTGITGAPGYDELDSLYGDITNTFFGGRKNIRDIMGDIPEWGKTGALSAALDINAYGKFSAANMKPDSALEALSPQAAGAWRILQSGYDAAKNQDRLAAGNLLYDLAPNGPMKGWIEEAFFKDPNGVLTDRKGDAKYLRDEGEWNLRKYSGLKSRTEALYGEAEFAGSERDKADAEKRKSIEDKVTRQMRYGQPDYDQLMQDYTARGGNPDTLVTDQKVEADATKQQLTPAERRRLALESNPSPENIRKYFNYEDQR